ncbi:MAG TPA: efflux RND transporter periplasmic adaptor subunit [Puia sp.]|nr:efflux RND transporter periplasmic adaptor subunit [Puia sp.]
MKKLIFTATILLILFSNCNPAKTEKANADETKKNPHYAISLVQANGPSSMIKLPGQLAAYQEVSIFPKVNGYVKNVHVDIGSKVRQGQLLMTLEAPELAQSTLQAKEKYARTKADLSIDREHYNRLLEASETPGAVSPLDLSFVKSKVESDSAVSNAAKTNWQMQETMQAYLVVTAPFDGVITERNVHPGALVSAESKDSKPMLELKEISRLRLQVDIPENLSGSMKINDTIAFYTSAMPGKKMIAHISRKSMNVNAQFRSERVEADVTNTDELLSPGMYADVVIYAKGNVSGFSVPRSAVVTSTEKKYVLVVKSGRIVKVDVTSGNVSGQSTEVFGNLSKGDSVVTDANEEIREGVY